MFDFKNMILKTTDRDRIKQTFPAAWHGPLFLKMDYGDLTVVIRDDHNSGCCLLFFDGIYTLYNLWTVPAERDKGYAQGVVRKVVEFSEGRLVLARYRNDELNIAKLFANAKYEIIHKGADGFIIVAARSLV